MSSGTVSDVASVGQLLRGGANPVAEQDDTENPSGPLTRRQLELNRLWTYYRCTNYDVRKTAWDGSPVLDHLEMETIVTAGFLPGGFYEAGGSSLPLRFRRPKAPFYLAKAIVGRFNGLLFGAKHHPNTVVSDDPRTDDWITGFCEVTRLWSKMLLARTYGGAMGSVAVGFVFKNGVPRVQVHDPRWCTPVFEDREEHVLSRFEKRYQYRDVVVDPMSGERREVWFWYRRVIDKTKDVVWPRVPADDVMDPRTGEPLWGRYEKIVSHHNFGFVPVVWIQNNEVQEDIDGDPDCHGAYDMIESVDALISQADRGIISNCDPTLHIASDDEIPGGLQKGSNNAIQTSNGGQVSYLEINGTGPKAAMELAEQLETRALRTARCVLDDNFGGPARTEKEVDQNYSNMLEQADILREQYGERGVKRLLSMALAAARRLSEPRSVTGPDGIPQIVTMVVRLPPNKETGKPRELGDGAVIDLDWPDWYEPSLEDISKAVSAAGQAMNFGLVDRPHAIRFIAEYFKVEDVSSLVEDLEAKEAEQLQAAMGGYDTGAEGGEESVDELDPELAASLEGVDPFGEEDEYDVPIEVEEETMEEELPPEELAPEEMGGVDQAEEAGLDSNQIKELTGLITKVHSGELPAAAAVEIIRVAYPVFDDAALQRMLGTDDSLGSGGDEVQKTALNGAQVTALAGVVAQVTQGLIARDAGAAILQVAFQMSAQDAERVLGDPTFVPSVAAGADGKLPKPPKPATSADELPGDPPPPPGAPEEPAEDEEPPLGAPEPEEPEEDEEDEEPEEDGA